MAIQANPSYRNYMTDLEFQKRFPNLAKQQQGQLGQGAFGAPLGSSTPYQNPNAPVTPFGGVAPLDITAPLNLGMPGTTPSNLATSIYGNPAQANQPVFGNIAQPIVQAGQTGQAAFGNITQPTTTDNLVKEVVGQDGQKPVDPNDSGMTDQMIEQLQVAEDARLKQVIREEEAKKLDAENKVREAEAKKVAEEAALTTEQRIERFTPVLQQQILGQQLTDKWSGQGHGSAEANAKDMSRILSSIGITDIRQFGKVPVYSEVQEIGKTYNGKQVLNQSDEEGNVSSYIMEPTGRDEYFSDGEGGGGFRPEMQRVYVPKDAKTESRYGISDGETTTEIDPSKITKDKSGKFVTKTGENFGNKVTGQQVPNTYSERQTGNAWGGTFAGKGNTGYRVQFADDGTPIFYTTYASSSDLGKLAPLLAIASFIPGLQPFAMAANALIAAKQGNILGALAGFTGLGGALTGISGLTNASQALNFAGAAKNKNILGMLSSGANLAGTDMTGLANSAGLGDVASGLSGLNLGGLGISDALKARNVVKAIQSGDPSSMIYALGGYAKDAANRDQNSSNPSSNELVKLIADKRRQSVPVEDREFARASVDDDFASSYGLGRLPDDLAALPGLPAFPEFEDDISNLLPKLPTLAENQNRPSDNRMPNTSGGSFGSAFAEARAAGEKEFMWNGKAYNTNLASKEVASYDSVGGGRGGQGGSTAEQFARANAVRGNAPQSDVAKLVSSLFPSAEAGSVVPRDSSAASQIPGYSPSRSLAPGESYDVPKSTYDQNNSIFGRAADALGLPQEFQRNVSNTLNALPGLNMPVGALRGANALSRAAGAADEAGAAKYFDEAGRYIPGSNAYKAPESASLPTRMTADPMMMFKMIQDLPNDVYKTPAVQNALKAIVDGDGVAAFKSLESNPAAKKELLKYAEKMGAQEVSLFKNLDRYEVPNPAKYTARTGGGYNQKTVGRRAEGGLTSLTKRQMSKA